LSIARVLTAVILTNVLFGFIPIPATAAMKSYSLFTMLFFRFMYTSIACILVVGFIRLRSPSAKGVGAYLTSTNLAYGKRNVPQILSLSIVAFMLSFSLAFFFFSYTLVGVVIATLVSEAFTPVLIAFWNWAKGTETMDILKIVYMVSLIMVVIIVSVARVEADTAIQPIGFFYVSICAVFWTVFIALIAKDTPSKKEVDAVDSSAESYKMSRSTLKLGVTFFLSGLMLFPITIVLPPLTQLPELATQCNSFYLDLSTRLFSASIDSSVLLLSFGLTFAPYLLLYAAQAFWPKEALTFDQWSAILGLLSPLVASYIGIFVIGETIRMDYTLIATGLLATSIAMRYFHEVSNKVVGFIFIHVDELKRRRIYSQLVAMRELREVYALAGESFEIYAEVVTSNLNRLYLLVSQRIRTIDGIRTVKILLVEKFMVPHRTRTNTKPIASRGEKRRLVRDR
jgi:DNA-binding Lrp family transcriptional regulator